MARWVGGWRVPEVDATPQPTPLNTLACDLEDGTHTVLGMATSHDPPETASRVTGPECTGGRLGVFVASCEGELLFFRIFAFGLWPLLTPINDVASSCSLSNGVDVSA